MSDISPERAQELLDSAAILHPESPTAVLVTLEEFALIKAFPDLARAYIAAAAREQRVRALLPPCENFHQTPNDPVPRDCAWHGRDIASRYSADGYCLPCKIRAALDGGDR